MINHTFNISFPTKLEKVKRQTDKKHQFFIQLTFSPILSDADVFEVWLIDMAMQWHFMAPNFCQYFRMLILNLGIRGWQFLYTDYGLTPETKVCIIYFLCQTGSLLILFLNQVLI